MSASNLRLDAPPLADRVLEKALAFETSERYPKTGDFGMAFFNALTTVAPWKKEETEEPAANETIPANVANRAVEIENEKPLSAQTANVAAPFEQPLVDNFEKSAPFVSPAAVETAKTEEFTMPETGDFEIEYIDDEAAPEASAAESDDVIQIKSATGDALPGDDLPIKEEIKPREDLAWERRSTDAAVLKSGGWTGMLIAALGVLLLCAALWGVWSYFLHRSAKPEYIAPAPTEAQTAQITSQPSPTDTDTKPTTPEIETPPLPREIAAPPDSVYFENTRENLDKDTLHNFRGFSLYFPNDWKRNKTDNKFIDISKDASSGTPIEQFLVSYYPSKGTFKEDLASFPELVKKSNEDLSKILPNYKAVSQGEASVNNGWRAYEVKFESEGKTAGGEKIMLWGRRLYIPAARPGVQSGFIITMLATSLSKDVTSASDVGVKGELGSILYTFEPDVNY